MTAAEEQFITLEDRAGLSTMPRLRGGMSKETAKGLKQERQAKERREAQVSQAGKQAAHRMGEQSQANGMQRGNLFSGEHWVQAHNSRQKTMESTFKTLYKPKVKPDKFPYTAPQ